MRVTARVRWAVLCVLIGFEWPGGARAQPSAPEQQQPAPTLRGELEAMAAARLISLEGASVEQLRSLVADGERLALEGRHEDAVPLLLEALESPRYAHLGDFPEYAAAEHMLATALLRLGSLATARRYLERALARGPDSPYYGPAVRRFVDVALALGGLESAADWLAAQKARSDDAEYELAYLRGRAHHDRGQYAEAARELSRIGKRSRFHGNAQYLIGTIEARSKRFRAAEQRFCAVAGTGVTDRYSFYVDERFFEVQDLARLALGRTAHEMRRGDDAFYYYFQVPKDSPRLSEAMFEAAYASYESEEHETAIDLLDQLEAHFPGSAFVDEASILRGYVSLARCEFEPADRHFTRFIAEFSPLIHHIDRLLDNPLRRRQLYDELLAAREGRAPESALQRKLLALLRVDHEFYALHAQVRALDAEAGRAGRVADALGALHARVLSGDRPRAVDAEDGSRAALDALEHDLELAELMARSLGEQLDGLRQAGAKPQPLAAAERELARAAERLHELSTRARRLGARAAARRGAPVPAA